MPAHSRTPSQPTPWTQLWPVHGAALADAGAAGERVVAMTRLVTTALVLLLPLYALYREPPRPERVIGLVAAAASVAIAALILVLARSGVHRHWFGFATSLYDVTSISLVLVAFLALDLPHVAVNSRVMYELYLLALACTCLRYDPRICLTTGIVATLQYGGIVWWAAMHWPTTPAATLEYGGLSLMSQLGRLALLGITTFVCTVIATRTVQLRQLSIRDGLTGLVNRAFFESRFHEELLRAERYGHPLAVALVDIDHFKQFNDSHGHPAGDTALRTVARVLRTAVRRVDVVARYGGEEFVFILPETSADGAMRTLEHAREVLAQTPIRLPRRSGTAHLTVSGGIAVWPRDGRWPDELLHVADDRLLAAKRAGRDRIFGPGVRAEGTLPAGATEPADRPQ